METGVNPFLRASQLHQPLLANSSSSSGKTTAAYTPQALTGANESNAHCVHTTKA